MIYYGKENYFQNGIFNKQNSKRPYVMFLINFFIDVITVSLLFYSLFSNTNMFLDAFVLLDVVLRVLIITNLFIELRFFKSQVNDWKRKFLLSQTLYQIELQKNLKNSDTLKKIEEDASMRAASLVDENFAEDEILKQAQ